MAENGHAIIYSGLIAWVYDVLRGDFPDLDDQSYHCHSRIDAAEPAIVIAASIANWITEKCQSIELYTNGEEPWIPDGRVQFSPTRHTKIL